VLSRQNYGAIPSGLACCEPFLPRLESDVASKGQRTAVPRLTQIISRIIPPASADI
jgi:hypothetical protein